MSQVASENVLIEQLIEQSRTGLSANDVAFARRVFSKGIGIYESRLRQWGFAGLGDVLDAGCGFGQWSVALARLNAIVTAIDVDVRRVAFVERLASALTVRNLRAAPSEVSNTTFAAESFDAVFCYGVLFVTPWRETLRELARVLRPGGRIYVNATGTGWYKHLLKTNHNATSDYDPRRIALEVAANTEEYERGMTPRRGSDLLIDPAALRRTLLTLGFDKIMEGDEGTVVVGDAVVEVAPFAPALYEGEPSVYEVVATKRPVGNR